MSGKLQISRVPSLDEANADRAANRNEMERFNQKWVKEAGKTVALAAFVLTFFGGL